MAKIALHASLKGQGCKVKQSFRKHKFVRICAKKINWELSTNDHNNYNLHTDRAANYYGSNIVFHMLKDHNSWLVNPIFFQTFTYIFLLISLNFSAFTECNLLAGIGFHFRVLHITLLFLKSLRSVE